MNEFATADAKAAAALTLDITLRCMGMCACVRVRVCLRYALTLFLCVIRSACWTWQWTFDFHESGRTANKAINPQWGDLPLRRTNARRSSSSDSNRLQLERVARHQSNAHCSWAPRFVLYLLFSSHSPTGTALCVCLLFYSVEIR